MVALTVDRTLAHGTPLAIAPALLLLTARPYATTIVPFMRAHRLKSVPSLEEFLFRQQVRSVYRDLVRTVYKSHERKDLMDYVRGEFRVHNNNTGLIIARKYLLNNGINQINQMLPQAGLISTKKFAKIE